MKGESWNVYLLSSDRSLSWKFLVIVVCKVKIFKIFVFFWFYMLPGLLENEKKKLQKKGITE